MKESLQFCGRPKFVVTGDFGLVVGAFVTEERAALVEIAHTRARLDQKVLVVMADLVPKMPQHRAVRLAEAHPERLAVGVQGFCQVDGDDPTGMTDHDPRSGAVAGQQVEGKSAVGPPEGIHWQPDVKQLIGQPAQVDRGGCQLLHGDGVVGRGFAPDQRISQAASPARIILLLFGHQPIAGQVGGLGAGYPATPIDDRGTRRGSDHRLGRGMKSQIGLAVPATVRFECHEPAAHRAGECAHAIIVPRNRLNSPGRHSAPDAPAGCAWRCTAGHSPRMNDEGRTPA